MKILDRITLLKAGYTKEDIQEMLKSEDTNNDVKETPEENNYNDKLVEAVTALATKVKGLEDTIHANNIDNTTVKVATGADNVMNILEGIINPHTDKKEDK